LFRIYLLYALHLNFWPTVRTCHRDFSNSPTLSITGSRVYLLHKTRWLRIQNLWLCVGTVGSRYIIKEVDDDLGNIHFLCAATRLMLKAITSSTSLLLYYLAASRRRVNPDRDNLCIYYYIIHKFIHTRSRTPHKTVVCCLYVRYYYVYYIM